MYKNQRKILIITLVVASICSYWFEVVQAGDQLEAQFQTQASKILDTLRTDKIQTVGVLKFSVRIGDGPFPSNVGALNTRLAEKLELALVIANPAQAAEVVKQVGVVRGASKVAASIDGATHLSPVGRKLLFSKTYPLAWKHLGKTDVSPDAFIVGVAQIKSDLSSMDVEMMLLKKADFSVTPLARLSVPTDMEDLIDSGESFTTRGIFDGRSVSQTERKEEKIEEEVKKQAKLVRSETINQTTPQISTKHPLSASGDAPIKFEILYDNVLQSFEFRDGAAFVKEPKEGQKVLLIVRRKGSDRKRYGVLVRVNGENTLDKNRTPDSKARIWIFESNLEAFSIRGFHLGTDKLEPFRVLSDTETENRKFDYGQDFGMISITVFEEQTGIKPQLSDEKLELAIQSQAELPEETKETRGELGRSLFDQLVAQDTRRGAIGEGTRVAAKIDVVKFIPQSSPLMSASIRYYKPTE